MEHTLDTNLAPTTPAPDLSVVVLFYDMAREAPRTLQSLIAPYQQGLDGIEYEIVAIDHGSPLPLQPPTIPGLGERLRWLRLDQAPVSPVKAINHAVRSLCRGRYVTVCIDGARIASSHLLSQSLAACRGLTSPLVLTLGWHLGPDVQSRSVLTGYDQQAEDVLLDGIQWPALPDRLFEVSVFAGSSGSGYFRPIAESNAFTLERDAFLALGGYHEGFALPGGGLANLELLERMVASHADQIITLIGDGTFHQHHGGAATSNLGYFDGARPEYRSIIGRDYQVPAYRCSYRLRDVPAAHRFLQQSVALLQLAYGLGR